MSSSRRLLALLATTSTLLVPAAAHSHIAYVIINGLLYPGFDPTGRTNPVPSNHVGWITTASDDGFVPPSNYTTPDIICHRGGAPSKAHAPVRAGDKIHIQWNGWPESHRGPVQSYLAPCSQDDGCASVNKTQLEWTKIDDSSPVYMGGQDVPTGEMGTWVTDTLIGNNNSWTVGLPPNLEPGPYVLRHEIIALHYAHSMQDGAQNYPQCVNLWVEAAADTEEKGNGGRQGGGDEGGLLSLEEEGEGLPATELYGAADPGVTIDIYDTVTSYEIPGPTVVAGAAPVPAEEQSQSLSMGMGTPVVVVDKTRTVPFPRETGK